MALTAIDITVEPPAMERGADTPERLLADAVALLRDRGWTQGRMMDGRGRYCIEGAIDASRSLGGYSHAIAQLARRRIEELLPAEPRRAPLPDPEGPGWSSTSGGIPGWNDRLDVTLDDVVELLMDAIAGVSPTEPPRSAARAPLTTGQPAESVIVAHHPAPVRRSDRPRPMCPSSHPLRRLFDLERAAVASTLVEEQT